MAKGSYSILGEDVGTGDPAGWRGGGARGCEGTASLLPLLTLPERTELVSLHPLLHCSAALDRKIFLLQIAIAWATLSVLVVFTVG